MRETTTKLSINDSLCCLCCLCCLCSHLNRKVQISVYKHASQTPHFSVFSFHISLYYMSYRFILEKYRGLSTRYTCPRCGRKHTFTRYIDTENNNNYLSERVGKCNRLDKCGYHYTPKQYFADNPWLSEKRDNVVALLQNIGKSNKATATKRASERISSE